MQLGIHVDLRQVQKTLGDLTGKQLPFATSMALNALAKGVSASETAAVDDTFKSPTPFTEKGFRVVVATKSRLVATVAVKDIQAQYLAPYVAGGLRFLGTKKGMLAPRTIGLNQYGNLPRTKLKTLQGKPNVYIGAIKTKSGRVINGVWQRPKPVRAGKGRKGAAKPQGGLKLLIQFEDSTPAPVHFPFYERARAYVHKNAAQEFDIAMRRALATAR